MAGSELSDAKQRVLDMAESLFMARGYSAITLRDIADALGIRQASLYYHFPDGKEQIYVEVAERAFARHRDGIEAALHGADPDLPQQLQSVATWFATQPPMNLSSIMHADMAAISSESAAHLASVAYDAFFGPLCQLFAASMQRREIRTMNPNILAGAFLAVVEGMAFRGRRPDAPSREQVAKEVISVLMDGMRLPPTVTKSSSAAPSADLSLPSPAVSSN